MKVGVTGANGLVGRYVCRSLAKAGLEVTALVRDPAAPDVPGATETRMLPTLGATAPGGYADTVAGLNAIVHLAAHVHVMKAAPDPDAFHAVNVNGSAALFEAAMSAGAERFIYMSSVKAAGERSGDKPLSTDIPPQPEDAYGRSKLAAEQTLAEKAKGWSGRLTILRPTFVYGWPATGNFRSVIGAARKGIPLPLAAISNRRDMTYAGNLADAVRAALTAPGVGQGPYFVSDGNAASTPDLFRRTADAFGGRARLFPVPVGLLQAAGALTGRSAVVSRLCGNFEVDIGPFCRDAGWHAPYKMSDGLAEIAASARADGYWETA